MQPGSEWPYYAGGLLMAAGALYLVGASRVFERATEPTGSIKFIRTALGWLLVTGVLFVLEPLHLRSIGAPFSHAYTGAIRHAVTVGFISQMILGVSSYSVPRLRGRPEMAALTSWAVFLLLNLGNTLRVALQIVTDYTPAAFAPMGISGFIELAALILWAGYMVRTLVFRNANESIRQSADVAPARI
jgi:hypothetical protein